MNIHTACRRGIAFMAGLLALSLCLPAFAGLSDYPSDVQNIVQDRLEVRFVNDVGSPIIGGELRVYDHQGSLMATALPNEDGTYTLGRQARGKLRFVFEDGAVMDGLQLAGGETVDSFAFIFAVIHPKVDYYAELMGVTPSVVIRQGSIEAEPDFLSDEPIQRSDRRQLLRDRPDLGTETKGDAGDDSWRPKSDHDTCDDAVPVSIPASIDDVLPNGPDDGNSCAGAEGPGHYYTFTAGATEIIRAHTINSPSCGSFCPDTIINVYSGPDCDNLVCVAGDDDSGGNFRSDLSFCATEGFQYWIEVENWNGGDPGEDYNLDLSVLAPGPPIGGGTSCEDAVPLAVGTSVIGDNTCAPSVDLPDCSLPYGPAITGDAVVFYSMEGTGNPMTVSTINPGTQMDSQIRVYCLDCGPELVCVASDDDSGGGPLWQSELTFCSTPNTQYLVVISGFNDDRGQFELSVTSDTSVYATIDDICLPNGPNTSDGQANGAACGPLGAVCIRCLDEANCIEDLHVATADRIAGKYLGDGSTCVSFQGSDFVSVSSSPGLVISSGAPSTVTDSIVIAEDSTIENLVVYLDVSHTWVGDVRAVLTHVDTGTSATLWNRFCSTADDILITFDDTKPDLVLCADRNVGGVFGVPGGNPLFDYIGESMTGTWTMAVSDVRNGLGGGTFNAWALTSDNRIPVLECGPRNNGGGNGIDAQPGGSDNCNDCPE